MDEKEIVIYIDLDALLDTRLGTILKIFPAQATKVMASGYFSRTLEDFGEFIDMSVFREAYSKRDRETLRHSPISAIYKLVKYYVNKTLIARVSSPMVAKPVIVLNLFPYVLDTEEVDVIIQGLATVLDGNADISVINTDISEVPLEQIKANYTAMIMYEYWSFLEDKAKKKEFEKTQCPELYLYGPRIFLNPVKGKILDRIKNFNAMEAASSPFIRLELLAIENFCMAIDRKIDTAE